MYGKSPCATRSPRCRRSICRGRPNIARISGQYARLDRQNAPVWTPAAATAVASEGANLPFPTAHLKDLDEAAPRTAVTGGRAHRAAIKLHQLRYIMSAAHHGSFRRAACALDVQQSTISRRIRELEERLGAPIFERGHFGVRLTRDGERFLDGAQGALAELDRAVDRIGAAARTEQDLVRIGLLAPLTGGFLDRLLRAAVGKWPTRQFLITEASSRDHIAALRGGRLDVAFLVGRPSVAGCAVRPLWRDSLVAVVPSSDDLAALAEVNWSDLIGRRFLIPEAGPGREMEDFLARRLARRGGQAVILRQAAGRDTLLHLVALGQGLMLAPASASATGPDSVVYRPIARAILSFNAIWSPNNPKPAVHRLLALAEALSCNDRDGSRRLVRPVGTDVGS